MKKKISYLLLISLMLIPIVGVKAAGFSSDKVITACGFDYMPEKLPSFTSGLYNIVKLLVPVILIVMGMIDFTKAVMANEEKKMKDAQKSFITRLIASIIIFFVMAVVQFVFKKIDTGANYKNGFVNCIDCLLNNNNTSCGAGSADLRKQCSDYDGKDCPDSDDYGHACTPYNNGSSYGGCKNKGTKCSDFSSNECNGSKTSSGVSCQVINGKCSESCSGLSYSSCISLDYCRYEGTPPNSGVCKNK